MEFDDYVQRAVDLVNADLSSCDSLRGALAHRRWLAGKVRSNDLSKLRLLQRELDAVVVASMRRDEREVVRLLNGLLERHRVRPWISGHDATSWHLHVSESGSGAADIVAGEALFGLMLLVVDAGADRLGRCSAKGCERAFVDTTTNRTRHFCSARCATRTNVANFRQRKRALQ